MKKQKLFVADFSKIMLMFFLVGFLYSCVKHDIRPPKPPSAADESAEVVYAWYKFIARTQLRVTPQPAPQLGNRNFAYIGVGLYEAVSPGIKGAVSLSSKLYQMPAMPQPQNGKDYLWNASANAALASMFKQFLPGLTEADKASIDSMENANNNRFRLSTPEDVFNRSQTFGRSIATAIYNWSATDNFNLSSTGFTPPVFPGSWVPTPPAFAAPVGAFLQNSRPFLEYSLTATAPPLPFPYSENPTSLFYKAARDVYDVSQALTNEQKAIANWWADVGGVGVGVPSPYHLVSIITGVLEKKGAKLGRAAEVYAKTGIGQKDGPIITFRGKFQYNLLRPVTYIQRHIDPTWQSYLPNPPYPEYPSGIMSLYGPVIQVLLREIGDVPVTDDTYVWRGLPARNYTSLSELTEEVALSRLYAGIHYRFAQYVSLDVGRQLGNKIADINLINSKH